MINIKYKALNKGYEFISENELLNTLLKNRGVENPQGLLHINESVINDGMLLRNMERGLNMLHWHIENNSKIHIIYDVDLDGCTSGAIIEQYIKQINKNIIVTHSMNENKVHGIVLKNIEEYDFDLLIIPDAGSSDIEQTKILHEDKDIDILILDHHKYKKDNPYAILINCRDGQYPNTTLSGAGVVYKFIQQYDKKYNYNYAEDYIDLSAIGMVADSMDLRNYETRYLSIQGLNQIHNDFIKEFLIKNKIEENKTNFEFVGWKIAPFINAVTRIGSEEERLELLDAISGIDKKIEYQPRRKHKEDPKPDIEIQTLQKSMVRIGTNIKARQDKLVDKGMKVLNEIIKSRKLDEDKIIIVDGSDIIEKAFTGLVANKLANSYRRPVVILKKFKEENGDILYGGSGRNYDLFPVQSLMELLQGLNTFVSVDGHDNAFGIKIYKKKVQESRDKLNEILKDVKIEDVYLVDYEISVGRLKEKHITQVGQWADIWGNTLKKPLFAITGITLKIEDIQLIGEKRNLIRIEKNIGKNKIVFIKKFASEDIYNKMIMKNHTGLSKSKSNKIKMDIIGEFTINEWNGNKYPQIEIIDFNVCEVKDFRF